MTVTVLPDGSDVFIGKQFVEYSGLSADKARRSGWKATIHPDDMDQHVSTWRASLVSGEPIEIESRFRRADGEYRWFLARAMPLRDDGGNILNWYEVLTDIEDRKRAEAALRDSEEGLRRSEAWLTQAQKLSRTGSWVYDATTMREVYWSDESYRIWGLYERGHCQAQFLGSFSVSSILLFDVKRHSFVPTLASAVAARKICQGRRNSGVQQACP
jgi:PAS domain S-box-containing protein